MEPASAYKAKWTNSSPVSYTYLHAPNGAMSKYMAIHNPEQYSPYLTKSVGRGSNNRFLHKAQVHESPGQRIQKMIERPPRERVYPDPKPASQQFEDLDAITEDSQDISVNSKIESPVEAEVAPVAAEVETGGASVLEGALSSLADINPETLPIEAAFGGLSLAANAAANAQVPANTIAGKYAQMQTRNNASTMSSDAMLGASLGSALGPIGTVVGGVLGGALGYQGPPKVPTLEGDQDVSKYNDI